MATGKAAPAGTSMSHGTLELLLDLVENKLGCLEVYDREDARELKHLQRARGELSALLGRPPAEAAVPAMPPPGAGPRRRPGLAPPH